ncbi:MAG: class I SAM-dependent methyltransferase [Candidatus Sumerlaeota bacterium]
MAKPQTLKNVLHVGCGPKNPELLDPMFRGPEWREIRLDIDPDVQPDIVGSLTDMSQVSDASMDALYSSHNLEHLHLFEVPGALREFYRVLKTGGIALIVVPDIQLVSKIVANDGLEEKVYDSAAGPVRSIDIFYGFQKALEEGKTFMAHKTAFTPRTLAEHLEEAGFQKGQTWNDRLDIRAIVQKL